MLDSREASNRSETRQPISTPRISANEIPAISHASWIHPAINAIDLPIRVPEGIGRFTGEFLWGGEPELLDCYVMS